jgi:hypothetical protein
MEDDEEPHFEPAVESNQSLIDEYLTNSISRKQTKGVYLSPEEQVEINKLHKFCEIYSNSLTNKDFEATISPYVYV